MENARLIAQWAEELRAISAMGLRFSENIHDRENYQRLQEMVVEMMAFAWDRSPAEFKPLITPLLSHPTPFAVGAAAVIDETGRILLIRRADNKKWAMPGGAFAVGETPAEGVVRETYEETGLRCEPNTLIGVFDSWIVGSETPHHLYHLVFLCTLVGSTKPVKTPYFDIEVVDARWFAEEELPKNIGTGHIVPIQEAYRVWRGDPRSYFDS